MRDLVLHHLKECGWDVRLEGFNGSYGLAHNVIAEKRGIGDNPGILIIRAHYDTVKGTPGADDNGVAVAGIMRLGELPESQHMVGNITRKGE
ncbi:MAG: M28 family peptidase [Planctomyces sp.]|nr:M28 family peptidase [Planctomyces sp.]